MTGLGSSLSERTNAGSCSLILFISFGVLGVEHRESIVGVAAKRCLRLSLSEKRIREASENRAPPVNGKSAIEPTHS